jgi:hypothetical protein
MGGVETSRGIAYQNAQAVITALDVLVDEAGASLRIEGTDDILDIEVLDNAGWLIRGRQIKTRLPSSPWGKGPILAALRRWAALDLADAEFEFVTDGVLGPTASGLQSALESARDGVYLRWRPSSR